MKILARRSGTTRPALTAPILAACLAAGILGLPAATDGLIAAWKFDEGTGERAADAAGSTHGSVVKARWAEGKSGGALDFEDYSLIDYLKPDVSKATRVVVPHAQPLNPKGSFSLKASVYPTRDPIYYGGIVEKGNGFGSSYRLVLLRGLRVRAAVGGTHATVTSTGRLSLNTWHDLEMRLSGGSLVLMVDGKEAGRAEVSDAQVRSEADLIIGERFSGRIDEVELSSR